MCELRRTPSWRCSLRTPVRLGGCLAKLPNGHGGWVDAHDHQTDVDLEILDLLREGPKSAYRLAAALTRAGEVVGTDAVRERLFALASTASWRAPPPATKPRRAKPRHLRWPTRGG